ncbi:MAG: ABC transporter substrate-binding protein [bacterium]|nr:ABC transporter substrate-binding protein [bacterium]
MKLKILRLSSFLVCFSILLISACSRAQGADNYLGVTDSKILLGTSLALTGHFSYLAVDYLEGALSYFNHINDLGGIYNRKVKLISYNDRYEPYKTVVNTQKLIHQDGVFMLFDYFGTPTTVKIIDMIHETKIPALGFFSGAETLRTPFRPMMFNVRSSYYIEAEALIAYFTLQYDFSRIAVVYQDDAFGIQGLKGVQMALIRRNLEPIATAPYLKGGKDMGQAIERISKFQPEVVILISTAGPAIFFMEGMSKKGQFPYYSSFSVIGSNQFSERIRSSKLLPLSVYKKIMMTQVFPNPKKNDLKVAGEYREIYRRYYPKREFNYESFEGFINAKVLIEALKLAGEDLNRKKIVLALESMKNVDIGGFQISYGVLDHNGLDDIYLTQLNSDGRFVEVV